MKLETFLASNTFAGLLVAAATYVIYAIYWELTVGASRRRLIASRGCQPTAHENPWDALGLKNFLAMRRRMKEHRALEYNPGRFERLGNTFSLNLFGRDLVMTTEPENLKSIMATDFKNWSLGKPRIKAFSSFLGSGIFSTDGAAWQHSRDLLRPNFHRKQVGDRATFEPHVNALIDAIPKDGSSVDLQDLFFRMTMDSATEFLFGESCNTLKPGLATVSHSKFAECFMRGQETIGNQARFASKIPILNQLSQLAKDTKFVQDFVDGYVERGLARADLKKAPFPEGSDDIEQSAERYIFLDVLAAQLQDVPRDQARLIIRAELLNILLAGRDTTASLLSNSWHVLARRPDIWQKLKAEVDQLDTGHPSFEQIKDMKYLKAFLNESLRIHPVVPGNGRQALADTVLPVGGGPDGKSPVFIPKGVSVGWSVWSMHRRKDFYGPDADEFKPERWLGDNGLRPGWEYLPFNGGPRICIGQQFALTEASYTTIRLIQAFDSVSPRDSKPWTEWVTLTLASLHGCHVSLTPRQK